MPMNHRYSFSMTPDQIRNRVACDEALLKAISGLEADAKLTASNASRAVHEAQNALLAAHAWLASAMATYESYRLEHLRLTEMVARSRSLLSLAASSLPDELVIQIAQMCVDEAREPLYDGRTAFEDGSGESAWNVGWVYPMAMSQVCRRWRIAILGCPRLWAYKDNLAPRTSSSLSDLIMLRSGACTIDALWNGSLSSPSTNLNLERWRTLKVLIPTFTAEPYPFSSSGTCTSLTTLSVSAFASIKARPPTFSSNYLSQMPTLSRLELIDVQFAAPPPYRHNIPIDLSIRYNNVISFREKDMADIAIVFPKLRKFSLHIRGPYFNKPTAINQHDSNSLNDSLHSASLPFNFPELEALDISAKDLSHSLTRMNGGFLPKLAYLRLRDNALSASTGFFQHLVRSRVPLNTLSLTDFSPSASAIFRNYRGITALEFELSKVAIEALRPTLILANDGPPQLPPLPPIFTSSPVSPTPPPTPSSLPSMSVSFPYVSTITLLPPSKANTGGNVGKYEVAPLQSLARVIRQRTDAIAKSSGITVLKEKELPKLPPPETEDSPPSPATKDLDVKGKGKEEEKEQPMMSDDTLVDFEPAGTMRSGAGGQDGWVFGHNKVWSGERARRMTVSGASVLGMVPIMDVKYTPLRTKGRAAMEEVYSALVESRHTWGKLIEGKFGSSS